MTMFNNIPLKTNSDVDIPEATRNNTDEPDLSLERHRNFWQFQVQYNSIII